MPAGSSGDEACRMSAAVAALEEAPSIEEIRVGRQVRESLVRDLKRSLEGAQAMVVARVGGLPAGELNRLRQSLGAYEGSFHIVKNSLCRVAFHQMGREGLESMLEGTCGVGSLRGDIAAACKFLVQFSKDHEGLVLRGGWMSGELLRAQDLASLAKLPPRPVLIAQALGGMKAPLTGLVGTLHGMVRQLVGVIHAVLGKKQS